MKKTLLFIFLLCALVKVKAQQTFPVNGSHDIRPHLYAFTNATIVVSPTQTIDKGTLLVKGQKIEAVGKNLTVPKGYLIIDLEGKFLYPSLIDAFSTYGIPVVAASARGMGRSPQVMVSSKKGAYHWNEAIHPEIQAQNTFSVDKNKAEELKKLGFGTVQSLVNDGIARGSSLVTTLNTTHENEAIILNESAAQYSFNKGTSSNSYPSSLMGSISLLRQTYYDSEWYKNQNEEYNISLKEFNRLRNLPQIYEVNDVLDIFRASNIAKEFDQSFIIKTAGNEYQRLNEVKATGSKLIVPLSFPKTYDVEDPSAAREVSLSQLKHWELAPTNLGAVAKAGISFSITATGLEKSSDFWPNIQKAIEHGLTEEDAFKALTVTPAEFLGVSDKVGSLEKGKLANFIITSAPLFKNETIIYENWVQGNRFIANAIDESDIRGEYDTYIDGLGNIKLIISGKPGSYEATIGNSSDTSKTKVKITRNGHLLSLSFNPKGSEGSTRISAYVSSEKPMKLKGELVKPNGGSYDWTANFANTNTVLAKKETPKKEVSVGSLIYPFVSYGYETAPKAEMVLIKNATIWTNEKEGIVTETDLLIENGKIKAIGKNLSSGSAKVVDGTGKHLTPGIIDEHSHIALQGINEGAQSVTSEVRMSDALNSEDINIYRQLAGGVTTSHLLHGSANAIGGQSQLIKLRWGKTPEGLKFGGNDGFIKFALGENVKQSNWGDAGGSRFPQTRMGVEQVFVDAFTRAKEYKAAKSIKGNLVRRDLELDALVEILEEKRFITSHSYVQSEINMLINVADRMGFKVNTFTHILEGYKLADKMADRGIAGSTFADWWAYKMEVAEAIPYNAYLMHSQGVITAINSDDAEMARRLNQEAAKVVKYGGISEEEAFKMVTLNPAKMLHIENRVGSIKVGKDADLVLWNANPLSIYAKAEKTYVDGVKYWDIEEDEIRQKELEAERARLIQKSLDSKGKGNVTQRPTSSPSILYHCETMEEIGLNYFTN